jgi:hypothetical protein
MRIPHRPNNTRPYHGTADANRERDDRTVEEQKSEAPAGGVGRVSRVIGPVVDVEFPVDQDA